MRDVYWQFLKGFRATRRLRCVTRLTRCSPARTPLRATARAVPRARTAGARSLCAKAATVRALNAGCAPSATAPSASRLAARREARPPSHGCPVTVRPSRPFGMEKRPPSPQLDSGALLCAYLCSSVLVSCENLVVGVGVELLNVGVEAVEDLAAVDELWSGNTPGSSATSARSP